MKRLFKNIVNIVLVVFVLNLIFILNVKAEGTKLTVSCPGEVSVLKSITCDVNVETDAVVNNISFAIENNGFDIAVNPENGFNKNGTTTNITLQKEGITSGKVATLTVSAPSSMNEGIKTILFKNIVINNTNDQNISFTNENITKTINVLGNRSNNNKLKDLTIDGKTIGGFSATKTEYDIIVNENKIEIGAVSDHEKAMVDGVGVKNLVIGDNGPYEIKVTAEDGSENIYKINVEYELPKSSDNNLLDLNLYYGDMNSNELVDFTFDAKKTSFDVIIPSQYDMVSIKSKLNDKKASYVKNYGDREISLKYGENKVEIRVKAENEEVKTYKLNIIREDNRNSDKTLSKLVVNGVEVKLISSIFEYRVDVRYKYTKSEIEAVPTNANAKVEFTDIDLVDGENTPIIIKVTSENDEVQEYKIIINRLSEAESKIVLENIVVDGYDFVFDINKFTYDLNLNDGDNKLNITVVPEENLEHTILGNENLRDGSTVIIRVIDDNGEKSYTINIHQELDKIMGIPVDIFCYIIFGIGVVSLIGSIVYVTKKNKVVE